MPTVALGSDFLDAYARIPRAQQRKVREFTEKFKANLVEAILEVNERRESIRGFEIVYQPRFLRHFTARFQPAR